MPCDRLHRSRTPHVGTNGKQTTVRSVEAGAEGGIIQRLLLFSHPIVPVEVGFM